MDKKSTVAIVILFTMIVIGSIVYTIFSVVKTDGFQVDTRANVIKEEMVSMEQSIDDGNLTGEDKTTTNSTVNETRYPINNDINNNANSNDNNLNQNTPAGNTENNGSAEGGNNPSVDKPNNNGGNTENEGKKPWVIKNSIFQINQGSVNYQDGIYLTQNGTNIEVTIDNTKIETEDITIPILILAPESYPEEDIVYYGTIGENELPLEPYYPQNGTPFIVFSLGYIQGESHTIKLGWLDGGVAIYTINFQ